VSFATSPGRSYRVEASDDLATWPISSPPFAGDGELKQWTDPGMPTGGKRFYRIVVAEAL